MTILITYASRYGATAEIAKRIGTTLRATGVDVDVRPVKAAGDLSGYDAFVIGSATYFGSWMSEATAFVRANQAVLASNPLVV